MRIKLGKNKVFAQTKQVRMANAASRSELEDKLIMVFWISLRSKFGSSPI